MHIEAARNYDLPRLTHAVRVFHEARRADISLRGRRSQALQQAQVNLAQEAHVMQSAHQAWIDSKFQPLEDYLGNSRTTRHEVEESFFNGLTTSVTMFHRIYGDNFDPQDLVVGYTTEFVSSLRICQRHEVGSNTAIRLAQLSYTLGANELQSLFVRYRDLPQSAIDRAALNYPNDPDGFLNRYVAAVQRLSQDQRYRDLPQSAITSAALNYPNDPDGFLNRYVAAVQRLSQDQRYRDLPQSAIDRAALSYPNDPDGFLNRYVVAVQRLSQDPRYRDLPQSAIDRAALSYPNDPDGFLNRYVVAVQRLSQDPRYRDLPQSAITSAALGYPNDPDGFLNELLKNRV